MKNRIKKMAGVIIALVLCGAGCAENDFRQSSGIPNQPVRTSMPTQTPLRKPGKTPNTSPIREPGSSPTAKPGKTPSATPIRTPGRTATAKPTVKPSTGSRVPIDTTGQYSGLRLKRLSDRNDFTAREIKNNKENRVSSLTGAEPEFKAAVEQFENFKKSNGKFVAYKALEYFKLGEDKLKTLNKALAKQNKTATDYYRIILEIYQYEPTEEKKTPYVDTEPDPYYFIATVYKTTDGQYTATYATKK